MVPADELGSLQAPDIPDQKYLRTPLKAAMTRTQNSILALNLKPQICWANLDDKVEVDFPVLLLQLPEVSNRRFLNFMPFPVNQ